MTINTSELWKIDSTYYWDVNKTNGVNKDKADYGKIFVSSAGGPTFSNVTNNYLPADLQGLTSITVPAGTPTTGVDRITVRITRNGVTTEEQLKYVTYVDNNNVTFLMFQLVPSGSWIGLAPSDATDMNYGLGTSLSMGTKPFPGEIKCFLRGAEIETPLGIKLVEDLQINDEIIVVENSKKMIKRIVFIISQKVIVKNKDQFPIKILKSAIDDNVPYKDLLITPEHCVMINEQFIPVRMLVNGRSIIQENSYNSYDIYHIETTEHSIVIANGMLTESYLNTDVQFNDFLTVKGKNGWDDAAVPLNTTRTFVENIYNFIEKRAKLQNLPDVRIKPKLTNDHGLYLTTPNGKKLTKIYEKDNYIAFRLPPNIDFVTIHSLSSRPSEAIGPFVDDRRQLGVLIGNITLSDFYDTLEIDTYLNINDLFGWSIQEQTKCRWTLGRAILPLNKRNNDTIGILRIKVIAGGPYIVQNYSHSSLKIVQKN